MTTPSTLPLFPWISATDVYSRLSFGGAMQAIQAALRAMDLSKDFAREVLKVSHGQLLLMPAESAEFVGVKVATVAPSNPAQGLERIQGIFVLMHAKTLSPVALIDGVALTALRTPAMSAAAADYLAAEKVDHLVVFGSGPQARGHIDAIKAIRDVPRITIVARHQGRAEALAQDVRSNGIDARVGEPEDVKVAQLIVCATTSPTPLFDGSWPPENSCTIAVGSHEPTARELSSGLMARAQIVVEDIATAMREAGDIIIPINEGRISESSLVPITEIAIGKVAVDFSRPRIFKGVGMSWQDLVVASAVYHAA